jgi:hypothetical protein
MRPRDKAREREILDLALRASGMLQEGDHGLSEYADRRALTATWDGVRTNQNWRDHGRQELGDFRNYLIWDTEDYWTAYLSGDEEAGKRVAENLGALGLLVKLWAGLPER